MRWGDTAWKQVDGTVVNLPVEQEPHIAVVTMASGTEKRFHFGADTEDSVESVRVDGKTFIPREKPE